MTVTKNTINNKDIGAIVADNLTICGQALGTGKLNVSCTANGGNGLYAYNDITINGGNVTTSVSQYGIRAEYGYFTINGGNVSASGTYNGIYVQSGTITLGWRNATDHIYASSYSNDDVSIKSGQKLTDGTNIYDGNTCAIDGKTLYPYIEDLALAANPHDGNYWTTFYCGHTGYKIDDGENAWAYTAEYDDTNSQLTLHKLGKVIPKETAVILVGSDNEISMTASTAPAENTVSNDLHGVDVRTLKSTLGTGTFYVMGKVNDVFGFYQYTAQYMPARKAYLLVSGSAAPGLKMVFDDESTEIKTTDFTDYTDKTGAWYSLDGRKLDKQPTQKGVYIHGNKKIVIK